jgi:hypothetical protein
VPNSGPYFRSSIRPRLALSRSETT